MRTMEKLPHAFLERMRSLLGDEYPHFVESLEGASWHALRVNTLRVSVDAFLTLAPWQLEPVAWCSAGFYYSEPARPGKHPYHAAGLYYIQEPSAMAVAEYLDPQPGEWVLDLAAAPGGKTTHIAALMKGKGLLIANEVHRGRAQALVQNIERLGITNAVVTNEQPERLARHFHECMDRILVDAPCSGEGMFRKNPEAAAEWSPAHVASCAERQLSILESVPRMLRPGGRLVYSTCTFAPEENEGVIKRFLSQHRDFVLEQALVQHGIERGRPEWVSGPEELSCTMRLWPHKVRGEGHFVAVLRKQGNRERARCRPFTGAGRALDLKQAVAGLVRKAPLGTPAVVGDRLYAVPSEAPELNGLRVVMPGLHVGTFKKNRFEPAHALAHSLHTADAVHLASFGSGSPQLAAYLRGEALPWDGPDGWYLVAVDGFGLGWAKAVAGTLKNHLPKGLRQVTA